MLVERTESACDCLQPFVPSSVGASRDCASSVSSAAIIIVSILYHRHRQSEAVAGVFMLSARICCRSDVSSLQLLQRADRQRVSGRKAD